MVAPAVIGAVGSILGGLFGRKKAISAGDNAFSHVQGIMRASSTFGFNPLTLLGAVSPMGGTPADNSSFGQGIANAAMIASDAIGARQNSLAGRSERLNQTQARLQKRLNAITIRAPVPGVYGRVRLPSDPQVYGENTSSTAGVVDPVQPGNGRAAGIPALTALPTSDAVDPRREVKDKAIETHAGVMTIDNPWVGRVRVPTLDGDEAVDVFDIPSVAMVVPQVVKNWLDTPAFGPPEGYTSDGQPRAPRKAFPELSYSYRNAISTRAPKVKRSDMFGTLGFR